MKFLEPFTIENEGDYNLNVVVESRGTESFFGLESDVRGCQDEEPFLNCTTRLFIKKALENCKCLPFNIRIENQVLFKFLNHQTKKNYIQTKICDNEGLQCVAEQDLNSAECMKNCDGIDIVSYIKTDLRF